MDGKLRLTSEFLGMAFLGGSKGGVSARGGIKILECLKITYFASIHLKTKEKPRLTNIFFGVACPEAFERGVTAHS